MKDIKPALTSLEQAILKLETAVYDSKKTQVQLEEQVSQLKQAIQTTYQRLNQAIDTYHKETN